MPFAESLKLKVRRKAHFRCCLCHALGVEIHHIVPQSEGGSDTEDNAAPLCPTCHETYGDNPKKLKFIREARDLWYELCEQRFAQGSGLLARFEARDNRTKGPQAPRRDIVEGLELLGFADFPDQVAEFSGILSPAYRGRGTKVVVHSISHATAGTVLWKVSMRRNLARDRTRDFTSPKFVLQSVPREHLDNTVAVFPFQDGEEMDFVGAGDPFILRVARQASSRDDTAAAEANLIAVEMFEPAG